jgi:cold shock protein
VIDFEAERSGPGETLLRTPSCRHPSQQVRDHPRRVETAATTTVKECGMSSGTVKWFNMQKGYGFIQPDDGGRDVFVHITAVQRAGLETLRDGQKITYEMATDRRTGKQSADQLKVSG